MAPLDYGYNGNGVYGAYGTTSTTIYVTCSTGSSTPWQNVGYPYALEIPPAPTKAEAARAAMKEFLGSVRPSDLFRPPPVLSAPSPVLHQMVHRRRCQSLGRRRPPRFTHA